MLISLTREFVNLIPINITRGFHSTGPKCTHSYILLRAFVGEVLSQPPALIVEKLYTLRVERTGYGQTIGNQL